MKRMKNYSKMECPCPGPIDLIQYLHQHEWEGLEGCSRILTHHGTRTSMNIVWRIWCLDKQLQIEKERKKEIEAKLKKMRKEKYLKELVIVIQRMRKLSEMLDLERGILNSITK
ncbi:MAG TPA: hypothetical protein PKJ91_00310 [Methanoregulaceae archaeon]|nr:hypothetical protein [Methanoregulaceae archaeon]